MDSSVRAIIADNHAVVRAGLREFLETDPEITVVGEATEALDALRLVSEHQPDVLLLDIQMPGMTCVDVVRQAKNTRPVLRCPRIDHIE